MSPTRLLALLLVTASAAPAVRAQTPASSHKDEAIRTLLELTGSEALVQQMAQQSVQSLRPSFAHLYPSVPADTLDAALDAFAADVTRIDAVALYAPVYARNFTEAEIDGMVEFYSSPLGRRMVEQMPAVMRDGMAAAQEQIQQRAAEAVQALQKRLDGYRAR